MSDGCEFAPREGNPSDGIMPPWAQEVGGSNPLAPILKTQRKGAEISMRSSVLNPLIRNAHHARTAEWKRSALADSGGPGCASERVQPTVYKLCQMRALARVRALNSIRMTPAPMELERLEREALERAVCGAMMTQRDVCRAQVILVAADGEATLVMADRLGHSTSTIPQWRTQHGLRATAFTVCWNGIGVGLRRASRRFSHAKSFRRHARRKRRTQLSLLPRPRSPEIPPADL